MGSKWMLLDDAASEPEKLKNGESHVVVDQLHESHKLMMSTPMSVVNTDLNGKYGERSKVTQAVVISAV